MDPFESLIPLAAIVFTFGIPGLIIFWAIYTKHRERMRLIEKGVTPEDARKYFGEMEKKSKTPYSSLKWGIIFAFLGAGILIANVLSEMYELNDGVTIGFVIFFIGLGYILYYLIASKNLKANPETAAEKN